MDLENKGSVFHRSCFRQPFFMSSQGRNFVKVRQREIIRFVLFFASSDGGHRDPSIVGLCSGFVQVLRNVVCSELLCQDLASVLL